MQAAVYPPEGVDDLCCRAIALNRDRIHRQSGAGKTPGCYSYKIVDCGSAGRSDQGDMIRECGQIFFMLFSEQTFCGQFFLKLFKGDLQVACPLKIDLIDNQLVIATRFINRKPAPADYRLAVRRLLLQITLLHFKKYGFDLAPVVFECEIQVAGIRFAQVGYFTADTEKRETVLKQGAN